MRGAAQIGWPVAAFLVVAAIAVGYVWGKTT
jgi:hypothetical protein